MTAVELTRFHVPANRAEALLAARPAMLGDFLADRAGFLGASLIRLPSDEWLDIVRWRSADDFEVSRTKGANLPGITAFFELIDVVISSEVGVRMDDGLALPSIAAHSGHGVDS